MSTTSSRPSASPTCRAKLTTDGAPESSDPKAGDLAFYTPRGNLALFTAAVPRRVWSSSVTSPTGTTSRAWPTPAMSASSPPPSPVRSS
ncbi:cyclophilin-like fold protein [Streptomyces sp. NBC_01171]|uniref:cyclophilin-like fold protein n=1 Tax=Streptomyces sp. NBC_01171 TaxID=2903757 RepID=UPI00386A272C